MDLAEGWRRRSHRTGSRRGLWREEGGGGVEEEGAEDGEVGKVGSGRGDLAVAMLDLAEGRREGG